MYATNRSLPVMLVIYLRYTTGEHYIYIPDTALYIEWQQEYSPVVLCRQKSYKYKAYVGVRPVCMCVSASHNPRSFFGVLCWYPKTRNISN